MRPNFQSRDNLVIALGVGHDGVPLAFAQNHGYDEQMPELCRFQGIIIRMYAEPGAPHHRPHFHAYYQDQVGVYAVDVVEIIAGSFPRRQHRLVEAWAELHQDELLANWSRLQGGELPEPIDPLH